MARTFLIVLLAATVALPASVSAQPNPNQPDTSMDANTRAEAIALLTKALRAAYVFPDVGDAVAKMLEERHVRGEYNSITSAKAFSELLTKRMRETSHDKHLALAYSSGVLPASGVDNLDTPALLAILRAYRPEFQPKPKQVEHQHQGPPPANVNISSTALKSKYSHGADAFRMDAAPSRSVIIQR